MGTIIEKESFLKHLKEKAPKRITMECMVCNYAIPYLYGDKKHKFCTRCGKKLNKVTKYIIDEKDLK